MKESKVIDSILVRALIGYVPIGQYITIYRKYLLFIAIGLGFSYRLANKQIIQTIGLGFG